MKYAIRIICFFLFISSSAQNDTNTNREIKKVTEKVIDIVSVEKGEKPDWKEFEKLFLPKAQIVFLNPYNDGKAVSLKPSQMKRNPGKGYVENGFSSKALGYRVEIFNDVAHVFQAYEWTYHNDDYIERGVSTYQFVKVENRWLIMSISFSKETESSQIPSWLLNE